MNSLYAVGFMILGVLLIIGTLFIIAWFKERGKRLPPRYIRETQRWLWLMNKHPLQVWKESGEHNKFRWKFKWTDWDLGSAYWYPDTRKTNNIIDYYPQLGDVVLVEGRYNKQYIFVITDSQNDGMYATRKIESCYLGYLYDTD